MTPNAASTSSGSYDLSDLPGGTYRLTQTTPSGITLTEPSSYYTITVGYGTTLTGKDFGYHSNNTAKNWSSLSNHSPPRLERCLLRQ